MHTTLIQGGRVWRGIGDSTTHTQDLLLEAGCIRAIGSRLPVPPGTQVMDATGLLLLPAFVDGHGHLDKTLWGKPWQPHSAGPTVAERIANERKLLAGMDHAPQAQSERLLRHLVTRGTTAVRSHVDIGPEVGLSHLHGVLETRERCRGIADLQLVAFPQGGVDPRTNTLDLLDNAVRDGAEAIGGVDPATIDGHPTAQLDGVFEIAGRRGCGVDLHLHELGPVGLAAVEAIIDRTLALGLAGRVIISHAFCLGELEPARLDPLMERLVKAGVAIMSHGPGGNTPKPPVRRLAEHGVRVFCGSDGVRDAWSPLNSGDMLERAFLVAYVNGLRDDAGLELTLQMATSRAADVLALDAGKLEPGAPAHIVAVEAETAAEAVAAHPPRRWVMRAGRVIARDGKLVDGV
ncbi:amidohydrolase [Variovorax dokdonensis]|uniref:Amidohydrolase n=1 Tax=Variovorax dokdonensis TaxID=344883 RepID=A0ABT7N5M8_9BURK|nr:amidohydrolase [Variovorax dokdonensis]MDM0043246.1 amidohydrolase [Variovorax dokdonensis]